VEEGFSVSSHKQAKGDVSVRIARIQGHLSGVARMVNEGRPREELVHQIAAVRGSLDSLMVLILEDVMCDCCANAGSKAIVSRLEELERVVLEIRSAHF
jgi:CsoR family transcriptional regulator, copper-sensing transcriptional repressor